MKMDKKEEPVEDIPVVSADCTLYPDGTRQWHKGGDPKAPLHRVGAPAWIADDGSEVWYENGKIHRVGGPAIEWADGRKEYWLDGQRVSYGEGVDVDTEQYDDIVALLEENGWTIITGENEHEDEAQ